MKTQNLLLIVTILLLVNVLFYNINSIEDYKEKPNYSVNNEHTAMMELTGKILEMNTDLIKLQSKSQGNLSINDLKLLLERENKSSFKNDDELKRYIKQLYNELENKNELPFGASVPGGSRSKVKLTNNENFLSYPVIASNDTKTEMNYSLIDKMDEIYFTSSNEFKGASAINENNKMNKDLEEFNRYVKYVNPQALNSKKEKFKGRNYVSAETLLNTTNYYDKEELKKHLKAERLTKELKGYCINLLVTDEMLPPAHPIFENFGGLMMEEVSENEYRYFIGSFTTRNGANNHLEKVLRSKFPEAEVVYYKKGNRKNNLWQFFFGPLG